MTVQLSGPLIFRYSIEHLFGTNRGCCHFSGDHLDHTEGDSCRSLSVTGWCSHGSFSLVLFVAWSLMLLGSQRGASGRMAARNVCPVIIAPRAESTSICPLTAIANALPLRTCFTMLGANTTPSSYSSPEAAITLHIQPRQLISS